MAGFFSGIKKFLGRKKEEQTVDAEKSIEEKNEIDTTQELVDFINKTQGEIEESKKVVEDLNKELEKVNNSETCRNINNNASRRANELINNDPRFQKLMKQTQQEVQPVKKNKEVSSLYTEYIANNEVAAKYSELLKYASSGNDSKSSDVAKKCWDMMEQNDDFFVFDESKVSDITLSTDIEYTQKITSKREYIFLPYLAILDRIGCLECVENIPIDVNEMYKEYQKSENKEQIMAVAYLMGTNIGILPENSVEARDSLEQGALEMRDADYLFRKGYSGDFSMLHFTMGNICDSKLAKINPKYQDLVLSKDQRNISMESVVRNAITSGVTQETVNESIREEIKLKENDKGNITRD